MRNILSREIKKGLHPDIKAYIDVSYEDWKDNTGKMVILEDFEEFHIFDKEFTNLYKRYLIDRKGEYKRYKNGSDYMKVISLLNKETGFRGLNDFKNESELVQKFIKLRRKYQ